MGLGLFMFGVVLVILVVPPFRWLFIQLAGLAVSVSIVMGFWAVLFHIMGITNAAS